MSEPVASVFNDAYVAEVFEAYQRDPESVDDSWRQFFRFAQQYGQGQSGVRSPEPADVSTRDSSPAPDKAELPSPAPGLSTPESSPPAGVQDFARKVVGISRYLNSIRRYGYLAVQLDPLGAPPYGAAELTPEHYGISEADLDLVTGTACGFPHLETGRDVAERLKFRYTRNLAVEFVHCATEDERQWFRSLFTAEQLTRALTDDEKKALLVRLTEVDGLERFLGRAFSGYKRFSIEGTDALVPMLDAAIEESAAAGARHIAISMAHRGRINVLAHVLGKPVEQIFGEFQGRHDHLEDISTGDVKYHLGFENERVAKTGRTVQLSLMPNPSHLEIVNPILQGYARAHQRRLDLHATRDGWAVVPICIHGDAAFPGEGVVAETFNLANLRATTVSGTLHIIVNNQVGFTTDPSDARSTRFASDLAKGFEMPILHVNADDAEACVIAMRIAVAYRTRFGRDFLVDLVGYRRHGHNEGDEPGYTQPLLYERIRAHPTARQVWGARLVREGLVTEAGVNAEDARVAEEFQAKYDASRAETRTNTSDYP
ncbi:MAG: thiamine pyrophosphate-dependent enzyme, partial [Gemmatimonadales bacterium]